jgi:hypothetical protein
MMESLGDQPAAKGLSREVTRNQLRLAAARANCGDQALALRGVAREAVHDDPDAVLREGAGDAGPDAARRAGHQSHAARERTVR